MSTQSRRLDATDLLVEAATAIADGPDSTPEDLNKAFFQALTQFMTTLTGHTSVITDSDNAEYMLFYRA